MTEGKVQAAADALISARGALRCALIIVALFCLLRGVGYVQVMPERIPDGVRAISEFVPLAGWVTLWFLSAAVAVVSIFPCWPIGSIGCGFMCAFWAIGYTASWIGSVESVRIDVLWHFLPTDLHIVTDGSPAGRDYLSASIYWTICLLLGVGYILSRYALSASGGSGGSDHA